jgi:tetratricopeptide (TPR) repeat protein
LSLIWFTPTFYFGQSENSSLPDAYNLFLLLTKNVYGSKSLVLSYSYAELEEAEQARFRALGVLAYDQPFDLGLLGAIWKVSSEGEKSENRALIEGYCEGYCEGLCLRGLLEVHEGVSSKEGNSWYKLHPLLQAYAHALLSRKAAEYGEALRRYQEQVIEIAYQFREGQLRQEEWDQLNPYLQHIYAVGKRLVKQTSTIETIEDKALLLRAQTFALNVENYLGKRLDIERAEWMVLGLEVSRKLQAKKEEAHFLDNLAYLHSAKEEKDKALEYLGKALTLQENVGDTDGQSFTLTGIGAVYLAKGEKDKALEYLHQALGLRAGKNKYDEACTLNYIGLAYSDLGKKDEALEYYEKALFLRKEVKDQDGEANTLYNMGLLLFGDMSRRQEGMEMVEQALDLFIKVKSPKTESTEDTLRRMKDELGQS